MPKLLILTDDKEQYAKLIQQANLPGLEIITDPNECDTILGEPRLIREQLTQFPKLKWVQSIYAGAERLMDPSLRRDYTLTNARNVFGESMSEFVFGYMLFFKKRILERIQAQEARQWSREDGGVLRGRTIGLLGVGSIGAHLAMTAKHFGMKVRGYTRGSRDSKHVDAYFRGDELLKFADGLDYLVVVLPKTEGTNKIVNAEVLSMLPPHAILINVGRGNAVDNSALVEVLKDNKLAAAVLDVTDPEPLPEDHPFWTTPNLLLTFHTSAISYPEDIARVFIENYHLYIQGKPLKYLVNFERGY